MIRTLRLIGARDSYITRAFTRRFTLRAAPGRGGNGARHAAARALPAASEQGFFLVGIGLEGWHWVLPLPSRRRPAAIAWLATRQAARRGLRRWS